VFYLIFHIKEYFNYMRENVLILGIVFFASLSAVLFVQNRKLSQLSKEKASSVIQKSANTWYQEVPLGNLPKRAAIIFCADTAGCNACLYAEASDWQKWLSADSSRPKESVRLICASARPKALKREFEAMGISYPIVFDSLGIAAQVGVSQSPTVVFCERGREIYRYLSDVNDRAQTERMQERFEILLKMR
jgi:hypothetical protein